jgi:fluoroacetyl-CoA thioesterase
MPAVLATGFLVGLLEWTCMRAVAPFLEAPRELTLGTRIDVSHCAPTPPGATVTLSARLVHVDGRRLSFQVQAHDGIDIISRGTHERFVVARDAFLDRVDRKRARGQRE